MLLFGVVIIVWCGPCAFFFFVVGGTVHTRNTLVDLGLIPLPPPAGQPSYGADIPHPAIYWSLIIIGGQNLPWVSCALFFTRLLGCLLALIPSSLVVSCCVGSGRAVGHRRAPGGERNTLRSTRTEWIGVQNFWQLGRVTRYEVQMKSTCGTALALVQTTSLSVDCRPRASCTTTAGYFSSSTGHRH